MIEEAKANPEKTFLNDGTTQPTIVPAPLASDLYRINA
jgi:hypothetical protein